MWIWTTGVITRCACLCLSVTKSFMPLILADNCRYKHTDTHVMNNTYYVPPQEILRYHRMLPNSAVASDNGTNTAYFGRPQNIVYMTAERRSNGRNIENIELYWNIASLFGSSICQLRLPVTNTAYFDRFRGLWKINCYMWKTCHGQPWNLSNWTMNLEKFAAENCGLVMLSGSQIL